MRSENFSEDEDFGVEIGVKEGCKLKILMVNYVEERKGLISFFFSRKSFNRWKMAQLDV